MAYRAVPMVFAQRRRAFLKTLASVVGGAALGSCGSGGGGADGQPSVPADAGGGDAVGDAGDGGVIPQTVFDVWRQVRSALRESPDHLPGQADRVVATKDPAQILAFVRDNIVTVPGEDFGMDRSPTDTRWGTRGVLRSGAGTMLEKAQLLAELYVRAGFDATLVCGTVADPVAFAKAAVMRPIPRIFDPQADSSTLQKWRQVLAAPQTPVPEHWSGDLDQIHQLAQTILAAMPSDWTGAAYPWGVGEVPLVQVTIAGIATYANPNVPDAVLGQSYTTTTRGDIPWGPKPFEVVRVTLAMCPLGVPSKRVTLAQAEYTVDALVGRQVAVSFAPLSASGALLDADPKSLQVFAPTIAVRGVDMTAQQIQETAVIGGVLTLAGDYATVDGTGAVLVNGQPLLAPPEGDAAIAARIASLDMELQASSFPQIRVLVKARDAMGNPVPGLGVSSLSLTEESQGVIFTLLSNQPPPPRVLFLIDTSDSIPAEFRGDQMAAIVRQIAEQVLEVNPNAEFASATPSFAYPMTPPGAYTANLDDLEHWTATLWGYGSPLWPALAAAADYRPTVIVFLTDGVADTAPTSDELTRIAAGPPVVMLGVGVVDQESLQAMADVGHGQLFLPAQGAEAVTAVVGYLASIQDISYEIHYAAPLQGPSLRHVHLAVAGSSVSASGTYSPPAVADRIPAPVVGALYLTIDFLGRQVTRRVAGMERLLDGTDSSTVEDELRFAMLGGLAVSIEGEAPSVSQWLDDVISARLTLEPLWKAQQAGDAQALEQALNDGFMSLPMELPSLHTPLVPSAPGEPLTFNRGLRAVLLQSRYLPATNQVQHRADLLPLLHCVTTDADGRKAVTQTLERTLLLAVVESALYQSSTAKLLETETLALVVPLYNIASAVPGIAPELFDRWNAAMGQYNGNFNVVPSDGTPIAFWTIDANNGTLIGVMDDGSGGGQSTSTPPGFTGALELLSAAGILGDLAGFGFMFGAVLAFEGALIKQIRKATIAIATMEGWTSADNAQWPAVCGFACDMLKASVAAGLARRLVIPAASWTVDVAQTAARMDAWYGLAHGGDGFGCMCPS